MLKPKFRLEVILVLILLIVGIVYVYSALSPSHYSVVLEKYLGLSDPPIAGKAKVVRGDEYSVVTPYFQIAVNNNFKRYNELSPYKEDLRFFYGLPLADWAIVFKPYMWGFWIFDAARAYSLYHYFMIAMFILGYTIFFRKLNLPLVFSCLLAGILFFSHHNQVWWSTNAAVLGLTIWIVLPFLFNWPYYIKFLTTFYLSLMALLALIYPPWQITLIYMFGIFALAFRKDKFRTVNILVSLFGFLLAGAVYYFYQQDSLALMLNTVYPGERSLPGGYLPRYYLWAFLAPHSLINKDFYAISDIRNMCEIGVVSSIIIPCVICFTNYKAQFRNFKKHLWSYSLILVFIFILFSWMYLPVPASIGQFILFDQINVLRILLTFGSSSIIFAAIIAYQQQWTLSWFRFLLFLVLTLLPPFLAQSHITKEPIETIQTNILDFYDYFTLIPLISIFVVLSYHWFKRNNNNLTSTKKHQHLAYAVLTSALLFNIVSFAHFNPIQSAKAIFSEALQETVSTLKTDLKLDNGESIIYQSHLPYLQTGSILNGLNIPSLNHALLTPQLDFYKKLFPETNPNEFNQVFNRYAKIQFSNQYSEAKAIHFDVVGLPTETAAQSINIKLKASPLDQGPSTLTNQFSKEDTIYPHEFQWKPPTNKTRTLLLNFTSPFVLDDQSSSINLIVDNLSLFDTVNVSAKSIAEVNLPWYFSEASLEVKDISKWNIYVTFSSNTLSTLENLPTLIDNIVIEDNREEKSVLVQQQKDFKVESISPESNVFEYYQAQPSGYIDVATYNPNNGLLSLEGWTPVEDTQSARWLRYKSNLDIRVLESKIVFRPGVPSTFGKNPYKGFKLIFKVPPHSQTPIPLCLYGSTESLGIFSVYSSNISQINCSAKTQLNSVTAELENLEVATATSKINGMIDHVRLENQNNTLVLIGWAPKNKLDDIKLARWFGYSGLETIAGFTISPQPRPDVARAYGDDYNMSGFKVELELTEALEVASEVNGKANFCLYSRSEAAGQFFIPYSQNQNIFQCKLQN